MPGDYVAVNRLGNKLAGGLVSSLQIIEIELGLTNLLARRCPTLCCSAGNEFGQPCGAFFVGGRVSMGDKPILPDRRGAFIGGFSAVFSPLAVVG